MGRSQHIAADGGLITVDGAEDYDLTSPWFSYVQFRPKAGFVSNDEPPFGANTGPKESVEVGAESINGSLRTEFAHEGGSIVIFDGFDEGHPVTLATWMGPTNATWGFHYRPDDTEAAIADFFSRLSFSDETLGLKIDAGRSYQAYGA